MIVLHLTSPYMSGPTVLRMQKALNKNKYADFYKGALDGQYGPLTAQAAHRAKYWLGYAKGDVNQVAGAKLLGFLTGVPLPVLYRTRRSARLRAAKETPLRIKALNIAKGEIGYRESGTNNSKYGQWYGMNYSPWCAMFCSWCYVKAGSKFKYAWVPGILHDAQAGRNNLTLTKSPAPGDLVLFDWDGGEPDHVGIFESWQSSTSFHAVEGNTSDRVARKLRYRSEVRAFVHVGG